MKTNKLKIFLGLLVIPLLFAVFCLDRLFSVPLVWISNKDLGTWFGKDNELISSLIRVFCLGIIYSLIYWIL